MLAAWTTPTQRRLFDSMHVADQRHGLDVVASLRAEGVKDRDVLLAGLLHDSGTWIWTAASVWPGMGASLERLREHADRSAVLAVEAHCSPRTVELIRYQDAPRDPDYGELLKLADEAK